jgi:DNA repair protein RecN (Recombination protein N)
MLERLSVRDFALIDAAEVEFDGGLVLFTGETGAGKSLIVGALGFLFGGRGDSTAIREGAEECSVSATLGVSGNATAMKWLASHDMPDEGGEVLLRRGLRLNGRSYAYIQNRAVSRADLAEFTALVADIHGQHEHQSLLDPESHLLLLDSYADLGPVREDYRNAYESWTERVREYRKKLAEAERREREQEFLAFAVKEIQAAKIKPNEDEELMREEKILSQHEKLFTAVSEASSGLSSRGADQQGALDSLRKARNSLGAAADIDAKLKELSARLDGAFIEVEDIAQGVALYCEGLRFDPGRLEDIESRLAELRRLKKKYGPSLDDVMARLRSDAAAIEAFSSWGEEKPRLEREIAGLKAKAVELAEALSARRKAAALAFSKNIEAILTKLGMPHAQLPISVQPAMSEAGRLMLSSSGMDRVEFIIAPNVGEAPKPLARIASGGELSRVALAIKAVLSSKDTVDTLVFDEIDTGIGGEVAADVGAYLKEVSNFRQVLCVTHLASIAARAGQHYRVAKRVEEGRTVTRIDLLEGHEREIEIARMLAGDKDGAASLAHAADLIKRSLAG